MKNVLAAALVALAAIALPSCSLSELLGFSDDAHSSDNGARTASNASELLEWLYAADVDPTVSCKLTADIDMTNTGWLPISNYEGTFDGGGHTISGLKVSSSSYASGFIGSLSEAGTIKDLHIRGEVTGAGSYTGGIAGSSEGAITGCSFYGTVTGSTAYTGGIVGYTSGNVVACYSAGNVLGTASNSSYTGGIAGYINSGELLGCYSTADVSASGAGGGIAGENHGGSNMQYNFYSSTVSASSIASVSSTVYAQAQVGGASTVTWESAKSFMNNALKRGGYSYSYKTNAGSDSSAFPLVLD